MSGAPGGLKGRRVLVTGGSGFIGAHVVAELRAAGAIPRVLDLQPPRDSAIDTVVGDLAQPEVMEAALQGGVSSIVHLAAETSVLRSLDRPGLTYRTNLAATAALLEAARRVGVETLVFASTNAVVGATDDPLISESSSLRPVTPYGATKAAAEMLLSAYTASYALRCTSLRLTNVYGTGMAAKDSIVARLMRAVRTGARFEIYGDGRQLRDYVHVADVVAAIGLALVQDGWSGPVVIGSGRSLSVLEVLDAVRQVSGAQLPVRHGRARPGEMSAVTVDIARARAAGWSPHWQLAEGLRGVWEEWSRSELPAPAAQGS